MSIVTAPELNKEEGNVLTKIFFLKDNRLYLIVVIGVELNYIC